MLLVDSVASLDLGWRTLAFSETVIAVETIKVMRVPCLLPLMATKMVLECSRAPRVKSKATAGSLLPLSTVNRLKATRCRLQSLEAWGNVKGSQSSMQSRR